MYRRGHKFKSRRGPEFSSGLILTATYVIVFITARIASIFISSTAVHIYDFHIFTVIYFIYVYIYTTNEEGKKDSQLICEYGSDPVNTT